MSSSLRPSSLAAHGGPLARPVRSFLQRAQRSGQTLYDDGKTKVILFGFAPGQELSAHTAPFPATLTFLKGEAALKLGTDEQEAVEGTFAYMPPYLEHSVKAKTDVAMLLVL